MKKKLLIAASLLLITIPVLAVFNEKESTRTVEEVEADLRAQLEAKFKHPFRFEFEWMDSIPPDPNGKLRMIVCKVD